jgi:hypothetical protein
MRRASSWSTAVSALLLAACSSGGGDAPGAPESHAVLVAAAGEDWELPLLATSQAVTLDASRSFFRDTPTTTRAPTSVDWSLLSGPAAVTPPSGATGSVVLPAATAGTYAFRVTAREGEHVDTDDVAVVVKPFVVAAQDRLHLGLQDPAGAPSTVSITASASGTGVDGPLSWSWTGMPAWLTSVTGTDTATLSFAIPRLEDLQLLPPAPRVLGLWDESAHPFRLTVTATDGVTSDSRSVLVSFGAASSGAAIVPVGSPVYLAGGSSADGLWTWSWAEAAAPAQLYSVANASLGAAPAAGNRPVTWFAPTIEGRYVVVVERTVDLGGGPAPAVGVIEVVAARYVSDGATAFVTPPERGDVRCAACHAGTTWLLEDRVLPWRDTLHAQVAAAALDPAAAAVESYARLAELAPELSRATTGFHLARSGTPSYQGSNGGFDDVAAFAKVDLHELGLEQLARRLPQVAALAQVQCEACHGPGSLHGGGDAGAMWSTVVVDVCARCHGGTAREWSSSGHRVVEASAATNSSCVRCHAAEAAGDPRAVEFSYWPAPGTPGVPPAVPPPAAEGRESAATCATCHDPHSAEHPAQLRLFGDVALPSGATVRAGKAAGCFQCHNARTSALEPAVVFARSEAHGSVEGDLLAGTNGAEFPGHAHPSSAHASPAAFVRFDGESAGDWCLACHPAHATSIRDGSGALRDPCSACHFPLVQQTAARTGVAQDEFVIFARGDWDGSGAAATVQEEIAGLLQRLGGATAPSADAPFGTVREPSSAGSLLVRMATKLNAAAIGVRRASGRLWILTPGPAQKAIPDGADGDLLYRALRNYYAVLDDGSFGLHNTGYAVSLLRASVIELEKNLDGVAQLAGAPYVPR